MSVCFAPTRADPSLAAINASAAEPKRVLILNSFGTAAPPSTIHETSFESELVTKMGDRIALDEVSLDMARNDEGDLQQAMAEYLEKRQAKWRPDLVVPIGSPAAILWPTTTIACSQERRFSALAAFGSSFRRARGKKTPPSSDIRRFAGFFEDILQVAPATKNIEVVIGGDLHSNALAGGFPKGGRAVRGPDQVHLLQRPFL